MTGSVQITMLTRLVGPLLRSLPFLRHADRRERPPREVGVGEADSSFTDIELAVAPLLQHEDAP